MKSVAPGTDLYGKVAGDVYYRLKGKPVKRKLPKKRQGPKTQGEEKKALYAKDFGHASAAGKVLRQALAEELGRLHDRYLYQHVNGLVTQLRNFDPAAPGERTVAGGLATEEGRTALADFLFHKKHGDFPNLLRATREGSQLSIEVSQISSKPTELLEVQVNFDKGKFRRHSHSYPNGIAECEVVFKRQFRSRKGFTDLVLVSGEKFLQGVVLTEEK